MVSASRMCCQVCRICCLPSAVSCRTKPSAWWVKKPEYGSEQYPGFFTHHALGFVRQDTADGKQQMRQTWQHILDALTMVLTLSLIHISQAGLPDAGAQP